MCRRINGLKSSPLESQGSLSGICEFTNASPKIKNSGFDDLKV